MPDTLSTSDTPLQPPPLQLSSDHTRQFSSLPRNLQIPVAKWKSHPNYKTNYMASWIRSHDAFRNHSKTVLNGIRNLNHAAFQTASGASPKVLRDQFLKWHNNMGNHERYEESKLYPFLARRWAIDTLYLTKEHGEMHQKRDRVLALFSKYLNFENNPSQHGKPTVIAASKELELAMEDYDTYVCIHLQEEEEFVVPMVLELEPEEYVEFGELGLTELLRKMDQKDKAMGIKTRGGGKRR